MLEDARIAGYEFEIRRLLRMGGCGLFIMFSSAGFVDADHRVSG